MADSTTTARVRLALEGASAVEQGLSKVRSKVSDVGQAMAGLAGGITIAGFATWVKSAIDSADAAGEIAEKTGLATKDIAGLQLAWAQAGGSAEAFVPIMTKLSVAFANGSKALDAMGISTKNADGSVKDIRQGLSEVSDKFAGYEDGARKTALAVQLFGDAGADVIPFLSEGADRLAEFDEMAHRLGLTLDEETTANAGKFNDTIDLVSAGAQGVSRQLAAQLLPTLATLTEELFNNITQGDNLRRMADFLAAGLKGLYSVGIGVVEVFKTMGVALGGTGAAIAAVLRGEFGQAKDIVNQMRADISASWAASGASIQRVWAGAGGSTVSALAAATRAAKEHAPAIDGVASASKRKSVADREAAKASKELAETMKKASALSDKISDQYAKDVDAVLSGNQSLRDEIELIGLDAGQRATLLKVKEAEIIASKELDLAMARNSGERADVVAALEQEIELRKQRIDLIDKRTVAEASAEQAEAAKKLAEDAARAQADANAAMWKSVDETAHDVFVSVANEGEDAFKRIGKTLKSALLDLLYQMTVKQWIIRISGQGLVGGSSGNGLIDLAQTAYSWYTNGSAGSAAATSAYSLSSGLSSGVGLSAGGLRATTAAAGSSGGAAAGAASLASYAGYAALIYAAVQYADHLYRDGWSEQSAGLGRGSQYRYGMYSGYSADPSMGRSAAMTASPGMVTYQAMEKIGIMSEKWRFILSSLQAEAMLFGRKLNEVGYEVDFDRGNATVGGYARYKGGWLRSNKTVSTEIDTRDATIVRLQAQSVQEGAKSMARAMGLSADAIDAYSGKLKINMKGANTSAEYAERMAKAMDDLQYSMLQAASGGKLTRESFDQLMEHVKTDIEAAGISMSGIADILVQGMTGKLSEAEVGDQLANVIVGGIYNSIASQYAGIIAQAFMQQIIQPIFVAMAAGVPISQAISEAAISNVVATAQSAAQALNAIFADPGFRSAIAGVREAIGGVSMAIGSIDVPEISSGLAQAEQQRYQVESELLGLIGRTTVLRERELAGLDESAASLKRYVYALQDAKAGVDGALAALERSIESERSLINERLDAARDAESALNDVFFLLRDNIRDLRGEVEQSVLTDAQVARRQIASMIAGQSRLSSSDLAAAIASVRSGIESQRYASAVERSRAYLRFAGELNDLERVTQRELGAAEQTVTLLEEQLSSLDVQLQVAKDQVDALYGVDTSVKSVGNAVASLAAAMAVYTSTVAEAAAQSYSSGGAPTGGGFGGGYDYEAPSAERSWDTQGYWEKNDDIREYYAANAGALNKKFGGRDAYLQWHWNTYGQGEGRQYAKGGYYSGGVALVGEEGPELINFRNPGQVYTAAQTQGLFGGDSEAKALLRQVLDEIKGARAEGVATALHASKMRDVLERVSQRGNAIAVKTLDSTPLATREVAV